MSTKCCAGMSRVVITILKISIFFNQYADIKVVSLEKFEFVDSQRAHCEAFGDDSTISLLTQ